MPPQPVTKVGDSHAFWRLLHYSKGVASSDDKRPWNSASNDVLGNEM